MTRTTAWPLAALSAMVAVFAYADLRFAGFSDGHLTELERTQVFLLPIFIGVNLLCTVWFLRLGCIAKNIGMATWLRVSRIVYAIFLVGSSLVIHLFLLQRLNSGVGG